MVDWIQSLVKYSPKHARKTWLRINVSILTCSVLLLIEILMTLDPAERLEGTRAYVAYNAIICFVWTLESGLHFLQYRHDRIDKQSQPQPREHTDDSNAESKTDYEFYGIIVEMLFAVYFLYDSVSYFKTLWNEAYSISAQLFDVVIDIAAYIYVTMHLMMPPESADDDENDTDATLYIRAEMT